MCLTYLIILIQHAIHVLTFPKQFLSVLVCGIASLYTCTRLILDEMISYIIGGGPEGLWSGSDPPGAVPCILCGALVSLVAHRLHGGLYPLLLTGRMRSLSVTPPTLSGRAGCCSWTGFGLGFRYTGFAGPWRLRPIPTQRPTLRVVGRHSHQWFRSRRPLAD